MSDSETNRVKHIIVPQFWGRIRHFGSFTLLGLKNRVTLNPQASLCSEVQCNSNNLELFFHHNIPLHISHLHI